MLLLRLAANLWLTDTHDTYTHELVVYVLKYLINTEYERIITKTPIA
jgi:hypothetical protein